MAELSDETLMMFADRTLDKEQHASVAAIIAVRPDLAAKVERFVRSRQALVQAFGNVADEAVPDVLVEQVRRSPRAVSGDNVTMLDTARARSASPVAAASFGWRTWAGLSAAASICLIAGAAGGWVAHSRKPGSTGTVVAPLLQAALEDVPSGGIGVAAVAGRTIKLRPVATFVAKDKRYCRDYALDRGDGTAVDGVACRADGGGWRVVAESPRVAAGSGMAPAGTVSGVEGDTIAPENEAKLIASKWRDVPARR